jgi:hypothetical protein
MLLLPPSTSFSLPALDVELFLTLTPAFPRSPSTSVDKGVHGSNIEDEIAAGVRVSKA